MTDRPCVLVVDDEKLVRVTLEARFDDEGYRVLTATNGFEALDLLAESPVDVVLTDLRMPSLGGVELFRRIRQRHPEVPVIFMTAFATVADAVMAMREGAFDYLTKPLDTEELVIRVARAVAQRRDREEIQRLRAEARHPDRFGALIYRSEGMAAVVKRALSVADSDLTVMIEGETGTGKEVIAQAIHAASPRSRGSFVVVNCGGLNPSLVDSELFGHEAGAFTGAIRQRRGRLELAQGGTILLDEVDDIPPEVQLKLLRFLQEHTFERVGGNTTHRADVRVIGATKRPLLDLVAAGRFRDDLYYRINTVTIHLPPLRERRDDILPLVQHFAQQRGEGIELTPEAMRCLLAHAWPGNVRELKHAVEHALVFARGREVTPEHLPTTVRPAEGTESIVRLELAGHDRVSSAELLRSCERQLIDWALARTGGNQVRAAELLGLSRTTFRGRVEAVREPEPQD